MLRYLHLVSYDIGDDKRQVVVREQVKNFAITGQKSAYECWITTDDKQNLANFAHHEIDNRDAFFIIKISRNYWQNLPKHCHIHTPSANYLYIG